MHHNIFSFHLCVDVYVRPYSALDFQHSHPIVCVDENGDRIIMARKREELPQVLDRDRDRDRDRENPGVHANVQARASNTVHIILSSAVEDSDMGLNVLEEKEMRNSLGTIIEGETNIEMTYNNDNNNSNDINNEIDDVNVMNISWKDIVKEYVKRYDEVFCLTSAKAHLDICDLVVDGAKDKWR